MKPCGRCPQRSATKVTWLASTTGHKNE